MSRCGCKSIGLLREDLKGHRNVGRLVSKGSGRLYLTHFSSQSIPFYVLPFPRVNPATKVYPFVSGLFAYRLLVKRVPNPHPVPQKVDLQARGVDPLLTIRLRNLVGTAHSAHALSSKYLSSFSARLLFPHETNSRARILEQTTSD